MIRRCPRCDSERVEETLIGGILGHGNGLDTVNHGTCCECRYEAPVALFQLYGLVSDPVYLGRQIATQSDVYQATLIGALDEARHNASAEVVH